MRWEERNVEVLKGANCRHLVDLVRVHLTEEGPEELATLSQEVPQAHVACNVASVGLHIVVKAIYVVSDRAGVVDVAARIPQQVILDELREAEPLKVLQLEEVEDEFVDFAVGELHLAVAGVVHVDRRYGRRDDLYDVQVFNCCAHGCHHLHMMDVSTKAKNQPVFILQRSPIQLGRTPTKVQSTHPKPSIYRRGM